MVAEARDLAPGRDAEPGLDHTAEHHAEAERARGVRHPHGLADAARLRELDRDAVCALGAGRDVGEGVAVLVDEDRQRRAPFQLRRVRVAGGQRLLAVLDAEPGQLWQRLERLVERPPLIDVDLHWHPRDAVDGADALDVEAVAAAQLQLQALEGRAGALGLARHRVRVVQRDRPGGRRAEPAVAEQAPDGDAGELAAEVVQRTVDRRLAGVLARPFGEPRLDLVERERVVAELRGLDEGEGGRGRLVVAVDRRRLAPSHLALVLDRHVDNLGDVLGAARDREPLGERHRDDAAGDAHCAKP